LLKSGREFVSFVCLRHSEGILAKNHR
jgi:hypothetical protein